MPLIFSLLISHGKCSLTDIKNSLYLEDCLYILDIIQTDSYNERIIMENRKPKNVR